MGQRVIPVAVTAEYVGGDGVTLGAAGSHNSVVIEYDFRSAGPQWEDPEGGTLIKYVLWTNPQGNTTNRVDLGVSEQVEGYGGKVYHASPTADAMCVAGWAEMIVVGAVISDGKEVTRIKTEPSRFRVLPGTNQAADNEGIAATVADQLQAEIEAVNNTLQETIETEVDNLEDKKVDKPIAPFSANGEPGQYLVSLGNGRTIWEDAPKPTNKQVEEVLSAHQDWVSTVQNGSLTDKKFSNALKLQAIKDYVTPQMYGAKGNGVADDTDAFQLCFRSGMDVYIPGGVYLVGDTIPIEDDTVVRCDGLVKRNHANSAETPILFRVGSDTDVQLHIDADNGNASGSIADTSAEIYIVGQDNVCVHDTTIRRTNARHAIWVSNSQRVQIERCMIDRYYETGIGVRDRCVDVTIRGNRVTNGYGNAATGLLNRYPIIIGTVTNHSGTVSRSVICDGNYIEDSDPYWEGIDSHGVEDAVITNNVIVNTLNGISMNCIGAPLRNVLIANNIYYMTEAADVAGHECNGIVVAGSSDSYGIVITGNTIRNAGNNTSSLDRNGIKIQGASGAVISNNSIGVAKGRGISLYSGRVTRGEEEYQFDADCENFQISGNVIYNSGEATDGILLYSVSGYGVSGTIRDCTLIGFVTGIKGLVDGNGTAKSQPDNLHPITAYDVRFVDCEARVLSTSNTIRLSADGGERDRRSGTAGEFVFNNLANGYLGFRCTKDASEEETATWEAVPSPYCYRGTITINSSGYADLNASQVGPAWIASATVQGDNSGTPKYATAKCESGSIRVYVRNADGTAAPGAVSIGVIAMRAEAIPE